MTPVLQRAAASAAPPSVRVTGAAQPLRDATSRTGNSALDAIEAEAWRERFLAARDARDTRGQAIAFLALTERDPGAFAEAELRAPLVALAARLALDGDDRADEVFTALAERIGASGIDVLYEIASTRGGSKGARRAEAQLARPEVRARASMQLAVTLDLRAARCADKPGLFARAAADGDVRTLRVLDRLRAPDACRGDGQCCWYGDARLGQAAREITARFRSEQRCCSRSGAGRSGGASAPAAQRQRLERGIGARRRRDHRLRRRGAAAVGARRHARQDRRRRHRARPARGGRRHAVAAIAEVRRAASAQARVSASVAPAAMARSRTRTARLTSPRRKSTSPSSRKVSGSRGARVAARTSVVKAADSSRQARNMRPIASSTRGREACALAALRPSSITSARSTYGSGQGGAPIPASQLQSATVPAGCGSSSQAAMRSYVGEVVAVGAVEAASRCPDDAAC
ncbi:MAG: hypothetical protein WKG00_29145 [Polyangiaceae bacterium]